MKILKLKIIHYSIGISLALLFFIQCTTTPKRAGKVTDVGVWQGKVLFSNKKTKKKKWSSITWASDSSQKKIRIDLYTVFYIPIATFIKQGQRNHLWIFNGKKYYSSKKGSDIIEHFTQVSLNPDVFFKLLSQPDLKKPWKCKHKKKKIKKSRCLFKNKNIQLWVEHHDQDQRVIQVEKEFQMIRFNIQREKTQVTEDNFKLLPTDEYEKVFL